jgi:ring-1,2-phenylacetyl-CoA epoxidase subunit PaaC
MKPLLEYTLRLGDDSLILGHRLSEWCGHGPILEEDIALTNIALDFVGQATNFLDYAAVLEGQNRTADDFAFLRFDKDYKNLLLVEQPNGDFGVTIVRQFLFDAYRKLLFEKLVNSKDETIAGIAEKSLKETKYHLRHSSEWVIRLGDGTEVSNRRVQDALNDLWRYTDELYYSDEVDAELTIQGIIPDLTSLKEDWLKIVDEVLTLAKIEKPSNNWKFQGGRIGKHSEHLGFILTELQFMQRAYPNMQW